ncbi:transcriptional regulator with XRE-family HTH domain [Catenuloplanes nepalensis]|uniref:Transcriptional regulator with XRE-family HTH domain n=1 Tax=Catenuloplanes nepalensis TaxID=587533 RepID=A0ABT9MNG1_9ACTN|nr:helix-turn-helix transcriptional regulator [Catenuloplanes nepalensis]MDP9792934.1 transcriptional regulator with XRE-family HTH domain [Catenuloplanes nepalensis]
MTVADLSGPTTIRRSLGRKLKKLRTGAHVTQMDVEKAKVMSRSTLNRIEAGTRATKPGEVYELCRFFNVTDSSILEALVSLADRTGAEPWWGEYGVKPSLSMYLDLEAAAARLLIFDPGVIHGLLQTPDYARALFLASGADPADVSRNLELRRHRQEAITRHQTPTQLTALIPQSVLQQLVGGPEVMTAQRSHLYELAERDGMDVRVLPTDVGAHALSGESAFTVLSLPDPEDPDVVYQESLVGARYSENPDEVETYLMYFDRCKAKSVPLKEIAHEDPWPHDPVDEVQPL